MIPVKGLFNTTVENTVVVAIQLAMSVVFCGEDKLMKIEGR